MSPTRKRNGRLTRSKWLNEAMHVLARGGPSRLNVALLCEKLGVTKGSFYAHFESRNDFVQQLLNHWSNEFTQSVIEAMDELEAQSAEDRLLALMRLLHREQVGRYDVAIRAWAAQEPEVAISVEKVDRQRFDYVRSIFYDIGFRGLDLHLRTSVFVFYHTAEAAMRVPPSGVDSDEELTHLFRFLTGGQE